MVAKYICHKDFKDLAPIDVFHKEHEKKDLRDHPKALQNRHILFRRSFVLPPFHKAILKITADDHFRLYLNGRFIEEGPAPSYPNAYYYHEIDVSEFLRTGENLLAVHTYYQGLINRVWVSGDLRAMLWCELSLDGNTVLVSDERFLVHEHTGFSAIGMIGYGTAFAECYDATAPECTFMKSEFDDSAWEPASLFLHADYRLQKQPTKPLVYEMIEPKTITETETGYRYDFGRETAGYLSLTVQGSLRDEVILHFAEEENPDGSLRYFSRAGCLYEEKMILSGKEDSLNEWDYRGFRYAEVILPPGARVLGCGMVARRYPFIEKHPCHSDNRDLQRILTLCRDTVKYGTGENFVDCPTREKGQYLGDVAITGRAYTILTGDSTPIKKAILDFCQSSFICPGLMAVSTASFMQEIADYSLQLPALVAWVYDYDHDLMFLKTVEPYLTELYRYFSRYETPSGLLDAVIDKWNLVDWPDNLRDGYAFTIENPGRAGLHNVLNAFWISALSALDEIFGILHLPLTGKTERAKKAFFEAFYDETRGLFCDTPKKEHAAAHSNLLPLLFEIGTEDRALCERLAAYIVEKGLSSMGVYMAYFALAALKKHGYDEEALTLATAPDCWLKMLSEGATTTFEVWGKEEKWNTSLFHPWATAPVIVFSGRQRLY